MTALPQKDQSRDTSISIEGDRHLERVNDATALNGGSAWHWYAPGRPDQTPSTRQRSKLVIATILWGTLACGVVMLTALI